MHTTSASAILLALTVVAGTAGAQHAGRHEPAPPTARGHGHGSAAAAAVHRADPAPNRGAAPGAPLGHDMWMQPIGRGWSVMGMAQLFPTMTTGSPWRQETLLNGGLYATQPVVMANLASPGSRLVLRTTLDFEAWTQPDGELTFGGWGEGFIDSRHPHTLLHEAMLTASWWDVGGGALSLSAGKGFAPYGTDDPMGRPAVKFPTNHHLSQVLERWTANVAYLMDGWSVEAGLFGGGEPEDPYDFRNIESFGDSWSARVARRFGDGSGPTAPWELAASFARVEAEHHGARSRTDLYNASARHAAVHDFGVLYALVEASRSDPDEGEGHHSILGEGQLGLGRESRHRPYARVEYATRPEYEREGAPGTPGFFRYDHDAHEIGATRWVIGTLGYGYESSRLPTSARPFVELQHNWVGTERGGVDPRQLYGDRRFWSASVGVRLFFGGGPMRMGSYGALDPMTAAMRPAPDVGASDGHGAHGSHEGHERRRP